MGKDGGIDLRNKENGIICQCKHIKKFSDLKSILKKELELSCPPAIKLYSFCPVFTGFFFICVRYAYDETEFRYDKALACGLEQQIKNMLSSGKKTINL